MPRVWSAYLRSPRDEPRLSVAGSATDSFVDGAPQTVLSPAVRIVKLLPCSRRRLCRQLCGRNLSACCCRRCSVAAEHSGPGRSGTLLVADCAYTRQGLREDRPARVLGFTAGIAARFCFVACLVVQLEPERTRRG